MMNYELRFSDSMEITTVQEKNPVRDGILVATGFNPWIRLYDGKRAPCSNYFYQLLFWRAFQHPDQRNAFRVESSYWSLNLSCRHDRSLFFSIPKIRDYDESSLRDFLRLASQLIVSNVICESISKVFTSCVIFY